MAGPKDEVSLVAGLACRGVPMNCITGLGMQVGDFVKSVAMMSGCRRDWSFELAVELLIWFRSGLGVVGLVASSSADAGSCQDSDFCLGAGATEDSPALSSSCCRSFLRLLLFKFDLGAGARAAAPIELAELIEDLRNCSEAIGEGGGIPCSCVGSRAGDFALLTRQSGLVILCMVGGNMKSGETPRESGAGK